MKKINVNDLKQQCPLPDLLYRVGLGKYARSSCPSPFRADQKASWGIFQYSGRWMYKDFATGEVGDEIGLLANIHQLNPHDDFKRILKIYHDLTKKQSAFQIPTIPTTKTSQNDSCPDTTVLRAGRDAELQCLSISREISLEGLRMAQERGILVFGVWHGCNVYGVKDQTNRLIELRRLDGEDFRAWGNLPERKSHALKGSQKNWPVGILEAKDYECIALAEGLPDLLALHQYIVQENAQDRVGAIGMLSAACLISPQALEHFKDKRVRIFPHADEAGIKAAGKWQIQLLEAGAKKVDFFNFSAFQSGSDCCVKDLCEFNQLKVAENDLKERNILP